MEQILKFLGPTFLTLKEFGFIYGIQGMLVRRNLEKLWFEECVTMSKYNVFHMPSTSLWSCMKDLTDIGADRVPFGIAELDEVTNTWNTSFFPLKSKPSKHRIAKITTVYESKGDILSVKDLFYTKQRERKSWWRQMSENPSIYYMSETKKENGKEYAEIQAQFPFGNIVVETINFKNSAKKLLPGVENGERLKIVEQVVSLDWGCLAFLCDGYIEIKGSKEIQMHPKLVAYKAYCKAIIAPEDDESTRQDLNYLTSYVIELLREKGVESVNVNDIKNPEHFKVAYIITVDSESLKSGLVKLVCQRTLCGEIVHITSMAKRMYDLCVVCKVTE
ncbi:DNA polymerase subunit gamma-2, mitochondrial [Copidosoma floridanum]|uniref:DNA polymerase subunit gamma-2, mitochondrial n=1 Tax=Copidosoma floridanum TaxID=29053 RepID=UPI0006C975E4|nr:DNA polymerase subunit gamma-2, mitochondrial [Copidosoma floridanum]